MTSIPATIHIRLNCFVYYLYILIFLVGGGGFQPKPHRGLLPYHFWTFLHFSVPNFGNTWSATYYGHLSGTPSVATFGSTWSVLKCCRFWQYMECYKLPHLHISIMMCHFGIFGNVHNKDSMFGHWYFKCCHIWQYIECQKFLGIPNVATFGGGWK